MSLKHKPSEHGGPSTRKDANTSQAHASSPLLKELKVVHESPASSSKQPELPPVKKEDPKESRERLLEHAAKFLEADAVKDAPLKEKLEFLDSKGLTKEEAGALVGRVDKGKGKEEEAKVVKKAETKAASPPPAKATTPKPQRQPVQVPIVTYPEYLSPAPKPPAPLVTAKSLIASVYLASGAAATIWGANKFVLTPMFDALTAARLELSGVAIKNLDELNERLTELVPENKRGSVRVRDSDDPDSDTDSDAGNMFGTDAMTQTSPSLEALNWNDEDVDLSLLSAESKLERLSGQLTTLVESHSDGTDNELTFALEDLTSYLETLTFDSSYSNSFYTSPYGGYNAGKDGKEDPILKVKQEIRSVKGVLLNSKNFPASR
ncbi:hypothetical protein RUND412_001994 [Rhizina undulata]